MHVNKKNLSQRVLLLFATSYLDIYTRVHFTVFQHSLMNCSCFPMSVFVVFLGIYTLPTTATFTTVRKLLKLRIIVNVLLLKVFDILSKMDMNLITYEQEYSAVYIYI